MSTGLGDKDLALVMSGLEVGDFALGEEDLDFASKLDDKCVCIRCCLLLNFVALNRKHKR